MIINVFMKPTISIITVVLNSIGTIKQTMDSILAQTYPNIELIVIDGGSTDGTVDFIKKNEKYISFWSSSPDAGIYDAMNKGIKAATGLYIWFMNSGDQIFDPTTLDKMMFGMPPNTDVLYGCAELHKSDGSIYKVMFPPKKLTWKSLAGGKGSIVICHQSFLVRRAIAEPYDLSYRYTSDHDWMIRMLKKSSVIINTNHIISKYALGGFTSKNISNCWRDRIKIVAKHYSAMSVLRTLFWFVMVSMKPIVLSPFIRRNKNPNEI